MTLSCCSASAKAILFSEIFFKNSNINNSVTSLPAFPFRTTLKSVCLYAN